MAHPGSRQADRDDENDRILYADGIDLDPYAVDTVGIPVATVGANDVFEEFNKPFESGVWVW